MKMTKRLLSVLLACTFLLSLNVFAEPKVQEEATPGISQEQPEFVPEEEPGGEPSPDGLKGGETEASENDGEQLKDNSAQENANENFNQEEQNEEEWTNNEDLDEVPDDVLSDEEFSSELEMKTEEDVSLESAYNQEFVGQFGSPESNQTMIDIVNNNYSYIPEPQTDYNINTEESNNAYEEDMEAELSDEVKLSEEELNALAAASSSNESGDVFEVDPVGSPMYYGNGNGDSVSLKTGDLMYTKSLFSFPGRNGLDLDVSIRYNSSEAVNIQDEFYFEGFNSEMNYRQFAAGWIFNFSNINIVNEKETNCYGFKKKYSLSLADGSSYEINDDLTLKDYLLDDLLLTEDTANNQYVLTYSNGSEERFDKQFGNIVQIKDIYGNTIQFEYTDIEYHSGSFFNFIFDVNYYSRKLRALSKITDSTGRVINIEYDHKTKFSGKRIDSITFQFEGQVLSKLQLDSIDTAKGKAYTLKYVEDAEGYRTNYDYSEKQSFAKKVYNVGTIGFSHLGSCLLLTKVTYPTGGWSSYDYTIARRVFHWKESGIYDRVDWCQVYKLGTKTDSSGYQVTYKYENDYSGYPFGYIPEDNNTNNRINADMEYHTVICYPGYETVYTFDRDHNMIREQTYDKDNLVSSYTASGGTTPWNVTVNNMLYRVESQQQRSLDDENVYKYRTIVYRSDENGTVEFLNSMEDKYLLIKAVKTVGDYIYVFSQKSNTVEVYRYDTVNDVWEMYENSYSGTVDLSKLYYSGTMFTSDQATSAGFQSVRFNPSAALTGNPWSTYNNASVTSAITYLYSLGGSQYYKTGDVMVKYSPSSSTIETKTISGLTGVSRGVGVNEQAFVYSDTQLYMVNYSAGTLTRLCALTGMPAGGMIYPDMYSHLYYLVKENGVYTKINKISMSSPGTAKLYAERLFPTKEISVAMGLGALYIGLYYEEYTPAVTKYQKSYGGFEKITLTDNTNLVHKRTVENSFNSYKQQTGTTYKVAKGSSVKQMYTESYAYVDKHGAPLSVTDKLGNTTTYEYTNSTYYIPTKITQYAGTENALVTNNTLSADKRKILSTSILYDDRTMTTTYTYDITYPGNVTEKVLTSTKTNQTPEILQDLVYEYNASSNGRNAYVTKETTKNVYSYNDNFDYVNIGDAIVYYDYDTSGRLLKIEQDDLETLYTYYKNGWIKSEQAPNYMTKEYTYTVGEYGVNKTEMVYGFKLINGYSNPVLSDCTFVEYYDDLGRVTKRAENYKDTGSSSATEHTVTTYEYDGKNIVKTYDGNNVQTVYEYDPFDRLIYTGINILPNQPSRGVYTAESMSYDDYALTKTSYYGPKATQKRFSEETTDIAGRVIKQRGYTTDTAYRETLTTYDYMGNVQTVTDPKGNTTTYAYNDMGQMTSVINAHGQETTYAYDAMGNLTNTVSPKGNKTAYVYDSLNRLIREASTGTGNTTCSYYKFDDRLKKVKDKENNITQYTYDESDYNRGMLLSKTIGETTISYEYDNWLNYSEINDGGQITSYTYTGNNKLKSKTTPDNKTISYEYDGAGNLKTVTDYAGQTTTYSYNKANQLLKATGGGVTQSYTYQTNGSGRLIKITTGTAKQEYTYNNLGEVTSMVRTIGGAAKTYDYTYDNNGNILQEKENNVVQNTYTYDELNQLLTATDKNGTKTTYEYDANNNVSSKTIDHSAADTYILTNAEISTEFTNITEHKQTMSYQNGNQLTDVYETVTGVSNGAGQTKTVRTRYAYTNGGKLNTIVEIDGGEQLYRTFNYNERNQMINHYYDFTLKATYSYDAEGYRSSKTVDGVTTKYYWDRGYTSNESDGTNFTAKNTIGIGGMIARKTGSQTPVYLMKDVHGDTTALLQNDSQVGTYEYDEYGILNGSTGAADNPYRYCGEYFDEETGFIYLRNRYYDPKIGRFTSEDPAKSGSNWYVYCENNPVKFVDPWGLWAIALVWNVQAQYVIGFGYGEGFAIDSNMNTADIKNTSAIVGTPGGGVTCKLYIYPDADSVEQLASSGLNCSVEGELSFGPIGISLSGSEDKNGNETIGVGVSAGFTTSTTSVGATLSVTKTDVNIANYDYSNIVLLLNGILNDEMKNYLNKMIFNDYILIPGSTASTFEDYDRDYINSGYAELYYSDGGYLGS